MMESNSTDLRVERLSKVVEPALRDFLRRCEESTFYYWPEWQKIIEDAYAHSCDYWVALRGEQVVGAFPVSVVRHPVLGKKMIAIPYQLESGAPLGDRRDVQRSLVERAIAAGRMQGVRTLEVRGITALPWLEELGFTTVPSNAVVTHVPLIDLDIRKFRRSRRQEVRQAGEKGIRVVESDSMVDLHRFRRLHLLEDRAQGTPQLSRRFFEAQHRCHGHFSRLFLAWYENRCMGGLLMLDDGRTALGRYATRGSREAQRLRVDKALLWQALSKSAEKGCERFSMGSSWVSDSGVIWYKESWGGTSRPIFRYICPIAGRVQKEADYAEGFGLAKAVWRRMPLPAVDWIGGRITRWLC